MGGKKILKGDDVGSTNSIWYQGSLSFHSNTNIELLSILAHCFSPSCTSVNISMFVFVRPFRSLMSTCPSDPPGLSLDVVYLLVLLKNVCWQSGIIFIDLIKCFIFNRDFASVSVMFIIELST